ncbi:MAG: hypothetical protein DHS20C19_10280 [Acidimicrobiales bacterium]|nr:MAG: hypothetical protein DHS20C19_10280 [Acidimicrobiales bacterium]
MMDFAGDPTTSRGVTERGFAIVHDGRTVPGLLWTPEATDGPSPVVLIGHGGGGHKRQPHLLALARRLVRHHGICAVAIDGPAHGERIPAGGEPTTKERRAAMRDGDVIDEMIADWKATLDAALTLPEIDGGPVGYWGLSMGTIFGLPFVAREPRVNAAVLGLMGVGGFMGDTLRPYAADIRCPVLFLQQLDDELIPAATVDALYEALATSDKELHRNPGAHAAVPPEEFDLTEQFLAQHLR